MKLPPIIRANCDIGNHEVALMPEDLKIIVDRADSVTDTYRFICRHKEHGDYGHLVVKEAFFIDDNGVSSLAEVLIARAGIEVLEYDSTIAPIDILEREYISEELGRLTVDEVLDFINMSEADVTRASYQEQVS